MPGVLRPLVGVVVAAVGERVEPDRWRGGCRAPSVSSLSPSVVRAELLAHSQPAHCILYTHTRTRPDGRQPIGWPTGGGESGDDMAIERKNLRSQVREELLARMRSGARPARRGHQRGAAGRRTRRQSHSPARGAHRPRERGTDRERERQGIPFRAAVCAPSSKISRPVMATLEGLAARAQPARAIRDLGSRTRRVWPTTSTRRSSSTGS